MQDPATPVSADAQRDSVLVVEDSMIIAMDAEEMLMALGFSNVVVASSARAALDEIERAEPQFAILDFNLGDETSESVAQELSARGVPFWFVTGYGEELEKMSDSKARGVVQKPYTQDDLRAIAESLTG